jgi:enamine deaminase RidA (YjgF/YER057c/UK114 family)
MIQRIEPNPRLAAAVVHGGIVYVSGQVPVTRHAPVRQQTSEILSKIDGLLARAGSDKTQLLNASIWLADVVTFDEMNAAWEEWLPSGCAPARATVEARIADPAWRVEIAVIAAVAQAEAGRG